MWTSCLSPLCQLSALWPRRRTASRRSCRWPSGASCRFPFDTGNKHTLMTYFWIYTITSSNEVYSFSRLFPYEKTQTANKLTGASAVLVCRNPFDLFFVCKNGAGQTAFAVSPSHHEGGHVSAEVGRRAVLCHVAFLRLLNLLLLLLDPVGSDLEHQTLQGAKMLTFIFPLCRNAAKQLGNVFTFRWCLRLDVIFFPLRDRNETF